MSRKPNNSLFDDHLSIVTDEYQTTPYLENLRLYYNFSDELELRIYIKTKTNKFKQKPIKSSKRDTKYFNHNGSNYTLNAVYEHIFNDALLEKGIDRTYSPRERRKPAKPSLFTRLIQWLRGGK